MAGAVGALTVSPWSVLEPLGSWRPCGTAPGTLDARATAVMGVAPPRPGPSEAQAKTQSWRCGLQEGVGPALWERSTQVRGGVPGQGDSQ